MNFRILISLAILIGLFAGNIFSQQIDWSHPWISKKNVKLRKIQDRDSAKIQKSFIPSNQVSSTHLNQFIVVDSNGTIAAKPVESATSSEGIVVFQPNLNVDSLLLRYPIHIVEPNPNVDYKINIVKPNPNVDFTIKIVPNPTESNVNNGASSPVLQHKRWNVKPFSRK